MIRSMRVLIPGALLVVAGALAAALGEEQRQTPPYVTKGGIEAPTKRLLAGATGQPALPGQASNPTTGQPTPVPGSDNPKVAPGKVRWHTDFAAACEAARKSGKPVLLFQMMGKLDDQFC
jgi:hypothetical protein